MCMRTSVGRVSMGQRVSCSMVNTGNAGELCFGLGLGLGALGSTNQCGRLIVVRRWVRRTSAVV
jgi:hypothetical protein